MRLCVVYEGGNQLGMCVLIVICSEHQNTHPTIKRRTFMQTGSILDAV